MNADGDTREVAASAGAQNRRKPAVNDSSNTVDPSCVSVHKRGVGRG